MFELIDNVPSNAVIKVIGVGGGGDSGARNPRALRAIILRAIAKISGLSLAL